MGLLDSFFPNPADSASPFLGQIPDVLKQYYNPYVQGGQRAYGQLENQYGGLMNNPGQKFGELGKGFQQSPGYQFQMQQGLAGINNAAGAGGMLGSPMHQQHAGEMATNLANQDYYNYMSKIMGMYGMGLEGEQGLNQMGYNASNELAQSLAGNLQSQASLGYSGQQNSNGLLMSLLSSLIGAGGTAAGAYLGGPAMLGMGM
jgi:hypothetical protein